VYSLVEWWNLKRYNILVLKVVSGLTLMGLVMGVKKTDEETTKECTSSITAGRRNTVGLEQKGECLPVHGTLLSE
jgi:hypothetical protein